MGARPALRLRRLSALVVCPAAFAGGAGAHELDVGASVAATAPMSEALRKTGPGVGVAVESTWGVLEYLDVGLRYSFAAFFQDKVDAAGRERGPVHDHGISAVASLVVAGGAGAGWFGSPGDMSGELFVDVGVGYHMIGRESVFGLDAALGYRLFPSPHCRIGPLFRVAADFATSQGHAVYVAFGISFGYDIGWALEGDGPATVEPAADPPLSS